MRQMYLHGVLCTLVDAINMHSFVLLARMHVHHPRSVLDPTYALESIYKLRRDPAAVASWLTSSSVHSFIVYVVHYAIQLGCRLKL
jgi:hypothetical protein